MGFEEKLSEFHENFFLKEFTFSNTTFNPKPKLEVELADNIIWIDDIIITFQLKERVLVSDTTVENEERWFSRKVIAKGKKQTRDTLNYLKENQSIKLKNHRGHIFYLQSEQISVIHKIICYSPNTILPKQCRMKKFHISDTAGIIHIFDVDEYANCIQTLLTPSEVSEYLFFREELINEYNDEINNIEEIVILGQYLKGDRNIKHFDFSHIQIFEKLKNTIDEWDVFGLLSKFPEKIITNNEPTDYYHIIREIAKLKRNELLEFKKRFI